MIDTARIFPIMVILSIIAGLFHFVAIPQHPLLLLTVVPYAYIMFRLRKDGQYIIYGIPLIILDFVYLTLTDLDFPFVIIPMILLFFLNIIAIGLVRKEILFFGRTLISLSATDREKARKALVTGDPSDMAVVAEYVDWEHVSK